MNRRELLEVLGAASFLATAARLYAAPQTSARILVIFLRGGYDAANLLVPISSDFYYEVRPNIAVPRPRTAQNAALPLDADWGLHPSLRDTIYPLYQKGQIAFIPYAGTQDLTYPVLNEYRAVFGGLFARMYGLKSSQLDRIFASVAPKDLNLV